MQPSYGTEQKAIGLCSICSCVVLPFYSWFPFEITAFKAVLMQKFTYKLHCYILSGFKLFHFTGLILCSCRFKEIVDRFVCNKQVIHTFIWLNFLVLNGQAQLFQAFFNHLDLVVIKPLRFIIIFLAHLKL